MRAENVDQILNEDNEVVVQLADGSTLRSGAPDTDFVSGDYVRLCEPDGTEYAYWDSAEWAEDPILVMGAIMNAAAGLRLTRNPQIVRNVEALSDADLEKELAFARGFAPPVSSAESDWLAAVESETKKRASA